MTRAMILAAGKGTRIRQASQQVPKALIRVKDKPLIVYHLEKLAQAGIKEVVINLAYLGDKIRQLLGNGQVWGVDIAYSQEPEDCLGTGGGIVKALPLLGEAPFFVFSCDIWTDFDFAHLPCELSKLAHLVLVDNPSFHPQGDFYLHDDLILMNSSIEKQKYTYANIGVYHPEFFAGCHQAVFPLAPLLFKAIEQNAVTGEHFVGAWHNVNTPEEFAKLE
ncbi:MAG: nucleotidyltransferase family protein [Gammaproteobacteria bacterium]